MGKDIKEFQEISHKLIKNHENVFNRLNQYIVQNTHQWTTEEKEYANNILNSVSVELETIKQLLALIDSGAVMSDVDKKFFEDIKDVMQSTAHDLNKNLPNY